MIASSPTSTTATTMTPVQRPRWYEYANEGRFFCGPSPAGHHLPARFEIPESGFVQCSSPALPQELLDLKRYRESRQFADADRLERAMRSAGVDVPDLEQLRRMAKDAPMCGRWIFLLAIRGGGIIMTEVSPDDRKAMRSLSTPAAMIEYLRIFPRR
jgi:hypothetical protein